MRQAASPVSGQFQAVSDNAHSVSFSPLSLPANVLRLKEFGMDPITHKIDLLLGGVLVLFYAGQRFNTPTTNRSSTTAVRYFVSLFFYFIVVIGVYAILVYFPHLFGFMLQTNAAAVPAWTKGISLPLLIALLLTVLLPKMPFLHMIDQWICRQLQDMAAIPWEVLRLSAELRKDTLHITAEEQVVIRDQLLSDGFQREDIVFEERDSPKSLWIQLTALLQKVQDWESDRRMAAYVAASGGELEKLRRRHQALFSKAKTCFYLMNEHAEGGATGKTHEAVFRYREDFVERVEQLRHDSFDFIARGVLRAELTDGAREVRLNALGFSIDWPDPPFTLNQVMLLFVVLCVVVLSGFVLFAETARGLPFGLILTRSIMISVIYSVAVACAVVPKTRWNIARTQAGDVRPIAFYVLAGLMAVAITQVTSFGFNSALTGVTCAWERSQLSYPWALISFCTALTTGIMVDNPRFAVMSPWQQRCGEGLLQGGGMFGAAYITYAWLVQRFYAVQPLCNAKYQVPPMKTMMIMAGLVGFVLGFFIPSWYRRHQEMTQRERQQKLSLVESAARRRIVSVG